MQDYMFFVSRPVRTPEGGWKFSIASLRMRVYGPFPSGAEARAYRRMLEARWRVRAESLGGSLRIEPPDTWIVTLPEDVPVDGLRSYPKEATPERKGPDPRDDLPIRLRPGPWKSR